jgi:hypothetical protein
MTARAGVVAEVGKRGGAARAAPGCFTAVVFVSVTAAAEADRGPHRGCSTAHGDPSNSSTGRWVPC